jgi:plastocyanin domain-containing protein
MANTFLKSAALLVALTAISAGGRAIAGASQKKTPPAAPAAHVQESQVRTYHVTASDGGIIPGHLRVRTGETIRVTFTSRDDKYSIRFKDFDIKETLEPEKPVTITISPSQPGSYEFRCARVWGVKRFGNNGTLVVTE